MNESKDSFHPIHSLNQSSKPGARPALFSLPPTNVDQLIDPAWLEKLWRHTAGSGQLPDNHEWKLVFFAVAHACHRKRSQLRTPVGFFLACLRRGSTPAGRQNLLQQRDDEHDWTWAKSVLSGSPARERQHDPEAVKLREHEQRRIQQQQALALAVKQGQFR